MRSVLEMQRMVQRHRLYFHVNEMAATFGLSVVLNAKMRDKIVVLRQRIE